MRTTTISQTYVGGKMKRFTQDRTDRQMYRQTNIKTDIRTDNMVMVYSNLTRPNFGQQKSVGETF